MRKAGIPCQYFCRKGFATWDVLLPTEEQAAKAAANNIVTKHFRLQLEFKGTRRLRVTVSNVPAYITGEVLAAYLSAYGQVAEFNLLRSPAKTAYGDYAFRLCLTKDGFKVIPETLINGDRQIMVMVEGRCPMCWACKQIGHIAKFCPQKSENATTTASAATTATISKQEEAQGPSQVQPKTNDQASWTEVTRKRKGSPKQGGKVQIHPLLRNKPRPPPAAAPPESPTTPAPTSPKVPTTPAPKTTTEISATPATPTTPAAPVPSASAASPTSGMIKKKKPANQTEEIETPTNLKRRRDSGKGAAKKCAPKNPSPRQALPLKHNHNHSYLLHLYHQLNITSTTFPPPKILLQSPPQQRDPLSPLSSQQEHYLKKYHRPYKIPLPRFQSAERAQPSSLAQTPSLPSLSPSDISSQELFLAIPSPKRKPAMDEWLYIVLLNGSAIMAS